MCGLENYKIINYYRDLLILTINFFTCEGSVYLYKVLLSLLTGKIKDLFLMRYANDKIKETVYYRDLLIFPSNFLYF